jgi:hypothetical protein
MDTRQENLKSLFQSVFWPAAAGNVFWSACTLLVDKQVDPLSPSALSRLAVLALLSLYLSIEWLRNYQSLPQTVTWKFWLADWLHICAVVFVAITAATRTDWLASSAIAYFGVTALGHFVGAWEAAETRVKDRALLGFINLLGVFVIIASGYFVASLVWRVPTAFLIVVGLWLLYRREAICSLFKS